jgi:RHS repeat-associated protein
LVLINLQSLNSKTAAQQTTLILQNAYGKQQELKQSSRTDSDANASSSQSHEYSYDDELRLTQDIRDTGGLFGKTTESFALDAVANRTAHSKVSGAWVYDANNRLTQRGGLSRYGYDDAGNLVQNETAGKITRYRYDVSNRLAEVRDQADRVVARYGYDPLHRRVWKEQYRDAAGAALAPAIRMYYLYSDEGLIAESEQPISLGADEQTVSVLGEPRIVAQYGPRPDSMFGTGVLFIKTRNSNGGDTFAYYHHNHLQTPLQATNKEGRIVWAADYDAFGSATITTPAATVSVPTIESRLRPPGQYFDLETGLHYNWHRYYDSSVGRYVQSDPIGLGAGINTYGYVYGNPMLYYDPYGLWAWGDPVDQRYVDVAIGIGDGITGGITKMIRNAANIHGGVNVCSDEYRRGEMAGIVAGLVVPVGRISYVADLNKISKVAKTAEEAYRLRNATKAWYRGRPLATWLERGRPNPNLADMVRKKGEAGVIASAGRANAGWSYGIVGAGSIKTGISTQKAMDRDCSCDK